MPLGIITAIAACPAIIGTTEAVRQGQKQNAKEKHRGLKSNLFVSCRVNSKQGKMIDGAQVVLCQDKLWLALPTVGDPLPPSESEDHPFAGYFLPFPDQPWGRAGEGLVSTISNSPPLLNWIYVDRQTHEVKYGLRGVADPHVVGPWDCTKVEKRLTLEGWEGFVAVRYAPGEWALYFDRDDDGLGGILEPKVKRLEVELVRREMRTPRVEREDVMADGTEEKQG
ncbi:hypothetical protein K402DRAFT_466501 [Aulographum hederae CBS 113979]|uniref:Uncharacterized protein n=1 Tax=Aulographum hederae CBS 113979 TaxID=1176131 RepID=A0A6G1GPM4_9PEZI|nr:hypothetical protein K402DRAFT_466501 [Aulographum hederae CBS 113979]